MGQLTQDVPVGSPGPAANGKRELCVALVVVVAWRVAISCVFGWDEEARVSTDHVSHRLVSLGFSERRAVRLLYALGATGGLAAVALQMGSPGLMLAVAPLFAVVVMLFGWQFSRRISARNRLYL